MALIRIMRRQSLASFIESVVLAQPLSTSSEGAGPRGRAELKQGSELPEFGKSEPQSLMEREHRVSSDSSKEALGYPDLDPSLYRDELSRAHAEILRVREELEYVQSQSTESLERLREELAKQNSATMRLKAEVDIAEHDRRLNTAQMIHAMVTAEQRMRGVVINPDSTDDRYRDILEYVNKLKARHQDLCKHVEELTGERDAARRELSAVTNSIVWRATRPLHRSAIRYRGASRVLVQIARLLWRILRPRPLFGSLRAKLINGGKGKGKISASKALQKKTPIGSVNLESDTKIAADPLALPIGLLSRTGVQPGFGSNCQDPWPADRPLVSVVIPCFNYSHFVVEAVQSVHGQTFQDLEVIVVEGGSTSLESRQQLADLELPRTRILLQPEANRAGANRNYGISQARGKYICCLDADDRIDPTYIEKAVFFMEHYGFDVVSTGVEFFGNRSGGYGSLERPFLKDLLQANYVPTCALFRRELWERAGGFRDSDLATGHVHEDWLFWVRLGALGARFWNLTGERLFKYRIHGVSLSSGENVLPIEHQRSAVRELNADVLVAGVIERSKELGSQEWRHPEPLRNLDRFGRDAADVRLTVLLALPFLIIGGAERLLSSIVAHLNSVGWRVIIVTTVQVGPEHGDTTEWFRSATDEIYHLPRFLKQDCWNDFIHYLIRTKHIDLLWIVGSAAFYERLPWLKALYPNLRVTDLLFNTIGHTSNNRKYADHIDLNLVENQEVRRWLIEQGEASSRVRLIESGLDLVSYSPKPKSQDVLQQLGASNDAIIIGFSGRWSKEKDPLGFVEIAKLVPEGVPVTFVMTGAGPLRKTLEAAVADANFPAGRFHLLGAVPDVAPFIASYDLLCLPSRFDGRPVVVLEALALGVPVLASSVGALPEMIEQAVSGLLCDAGDYEAFAKSIVQLAGDPSRLQQMKHNARRSAEQKFDARRMLADYEAVLSGLLAKHSQDESYIDAGQQSRT